MDFYEFYLIPKLRNLQKFPPSLDRPISKPYGDPLTSQRTFWCKKYLVWVYIFSCRIRHTRVRSKLVLTSIKWKPSIYVDISILCRNFTFGCFINHSYLDTSIFISIWWFFNTKILPVTNILFILQDTWLSFRRPLAYNREDSWNNIGLGQLITLSSRTIFLFIF